MPDYYSKQWLPLLSYGRVCIDVPSSHTFAALGKLPIVPNVQFNQTKHPNYYCPYVEGELVYFVILNRSSNW